MLHKKCNGRIKQQLFCPTDNEIVERTDTVKGYEYARGQYVTFTEDELKTFESERSNAIEITEFVPLESVDFVHVEKSYYLGPDKGGDKAYKLLSEAMGNKDKVAVGRWAARGKEQLVLVRPYGDDGLILHQLYYSNEVRAFDEIDTGAKLGFTRQGARARREAHRAALERRVRSREVLRHFQRSRPHRRSIRRCRGKRSRSPPRRPRLRSSICSRP